MKTFYRVSNLITNQGLWYDQQGNFTGLIHNKFNFCTNHALSMDFDPDIVSWLSTTDSLDTLFHWFTKKDIIQLQEHGYFIHEYLSPIYREYANHWIMKQNSGILVNRFEITSLT